MPGPDRKRRLTAFIVAMAVLIVTPLAVVASDRFNDVPDSNIFHDDIAWLADNDVTRGCNPPDNDEFCPSDNVTRQQMAAFMRRLAENEVVNAATANEADHAADADTLGGFEPETYRSFTATSNCVGDCTTEPELLTVTVDAPTEGSLRISYASTIQATGTGISHLWVTTDAECEWFIAPLNAIPGSFSFTTHEDNLDWHDQGGTLAVAAPAGATDLTLCQAHTGGGVEYGSIVAVWDAGSASGLAPLSATMEFSPAQLEQFESAGATG